MGLFKWLSGGVTKRPTAVLGSWLVITAIAVTAVLSGFGQGGLFDRLKNSADQIPGTQSAVVDERTASGEALSFVFSGVKIPDEMQTLGPAVSQAREKIVGIESVASVADPFMFPDPTDPRSGALLSKNADGFVMAVQIADDADDAQVNDAREQTVQEIDALVDQVHAQLPNLVVNELSIATIGDEINGVVQRDLIRGEAVGLPIALILMVIIFGGLLAAMLPLIGAIIAILIGLGALWAFTFAMDMNSFVLNVISIIGVALSIDYGLLVVSRYREEIAARLIERGLPKDGTQLPESAELKTMVREATAKTVDTAGRTVFFSALTIAFALCGLLVFNSSILRSVALGGILVTILAVLAAITLVPAVIVLMGRKLVGPSWLHRVPGVRAVVNAVGDSSRDEGGFSKLARIVRKAPLVFAVVVIAVMSIMLIPIGDLKMRGSLMEYLPADSEPMIAYTALQNDYPALAVPEVKVVAEKPIAEIQPYLQHIQQTYPDVTFLNPQPLADDPNQTVVDIHLDVDDPSGDRVEEVFTDLREYDAGFPTYVGGVAAAQYDFIQELSAKSGWALAIICVSVFILLFFMSGSLIVPLKALIVNAFSILTALGATSWLFQGGHLGLPKTPGLETFIVACMLAFGFGLAMDYEVFLVARMKEFWDAGMSNDEAVIHGLQRSGRIITSAAAIIVAVFLGFVSGEMLAIKQIGVGLAIMIVVDATIVRLLLVPAIMFMLGKWNWWAPAPLKRLYERHQIQH